MGVQGWRSVSIVAGALALCALALILLPGASAQSSNCGGSADLGGYTCIDSTAAGGPVPSLVDISGNGTMVAPPLGDDSESSLTLPFTFTWYGHATTDIKLSSNGYVCLWPQSSGDCTTIGYFPPPDSFDPNYMVAAYDGDLHCNNSPTCAYSTSWGPVGSRVFAVMVNGEECYPFPSGCNLHFEYKILEASSCIEVHYGTMVDPTGNSRFAGTEGQSPGGTYTGLTYYDASGVGTLPNTAVRYCQTSTPPPACTPSPQNIATGGTAAFTASGGTPPYSWSAPGGSPTSGSGAAFSSTYANAGTYTVTVTDGVNASFSCTVVVTAPGCGYSVNANQPYNWQEIMPTGTPVSVGGAAEDDGFEVQPIGFPFTFCGATYTNVELGSNGLLCLGVTGNCNVLTPDPLPSFFNPYPAIFGWNTDLYPPGCGGGSCVKFQTLGPVGSRVFIYEMSGVPLCCGTTMGATFEIKLFETTNCFEVHFLDVMDGDGFRTVLGGFQDASALGYYTYAYSSPGWARTAQAWSACPTPPYVAVDDWFDLNEDQGAQPLDVLANDLDPGGGAFAITAVSSPTIGTRTFTASGVTYTPNTDKNGVDSLTYTVTTATGSSTATIHLNVTAVNDRPAFTATLASVEAAQSGPALTFPGWATGVVPGPATATDEATQSITFNRVLDTNPTIFAVEPTLQRAATAGSTVPTPASGAFAFLALTPSATPGTSTVCFQAEDGGGAATSTDSWGGTVTGEPFSAPPDRCLDVIVNPCDGQPDGIYPAWRWLTLQVPGPSGFANVFANDVASPLQPAALTTAASGGPLSFDAATGGFTYQAQGTFAGDDHFQYTIRCGNAVSSPIDVTIRVRVNQPPIAYFEPSSPTATPGQGVFFNSCPAPSPRCTYDPDGQIVSYLWEFGDGYTSTSGLPSHVFAGVGTYEVRLTVRDDLGNTTSYSRTVAVQWPDSAPVLSEGGGGALPPIAYAGENRTVRQGETVQMAGSQRGGGDAATFAWEQVLGPTVALSGAATASPSFVAPTVGDRPADLVFSLRVTEGGLSSRLAFVTIHVVDGNQVPVADAGGTIDALAGEIVSLDGSRSSDADGDRLTYAWEQVRKPGDSLIPLSDPAALAPTFTAPASGVVHFRLTVSDGRAIAVDEAIVMVQSLPVPRAGFTFVPGAGGEVRFDAAPGLQDVAWDFGDGGVASGPQAVHRFTPGSYTVTMTAGKGARSASERVDVQGGVSPVAAAASSGANWLPAAVAVAGILAVGAAAVVFLVRRRR
ncbi:MAG: PKD domain-containing protein [Thermoplasmatota archaeon]